MNTVHNRLLSQISPMKIIFLGYCGIILTGALLLMLPFAAKNGQVTSFLDTFFTATSATCVTGLIRFDTYTHWTLFGQLVILALIQVGGLGFMTFTLLVISFTRRRIGLSSRVLMKESVSSPQLGGMVRMTRFIFVGTALFEGLGAILLAFYYCPLFGLGKGIYFSIFHSISAFCNAGFDLMGETAPFSSLTSAADHVYVNVIIMALIVIGGLGFFVWADIREHKFHFSQYRLHSKIVLVMSAALILGGTAVLFITEYNNPANTASVPQSILHAMFQSVTARTAGFNTVDLTAMTEAGQLVMICLMLIGGSPGSTAGGAKTTTLAILLASVFSTIKRKKSVDCFRRRVDDDTLRSASCVFMMYLLLSIFATITISCVENIPILPAMYEVASAIATVGLSLSLSPELGAVSCVILSALMIFGRVGSITILLAFASNRPGVVSKHPAEKVQVG